MHRATRILLALLAAAAAAPSSASADLNENQDRHAELVAYGEGVTRCAVNLDRTQALLKLTEYGNWKAGGSTTCSVPLQQVGDAYVSSSKGVFDPAACTGFRADCSSTVSGLGGAPRSVTIRYHVELVAPRGQGWIAAPSHCTGVGTHRVVCDFEIDTSDV